MRNGTLPASFISTPTPRVISVLSGKGGVGKSVIAANLADQLALCGARVLLIDADFGCGNQHLLVNVTAEYGIGEYASNQLGLAEAVTTLPSGVDLLAGTWHEMLGEERNIRFTALLMQKIRTDAQAYDFVILDHASGRSNQAALLAHASDVVFLIAIPELTSLSDAYGLYKHMLSLGDSVECRLIVNRVQSEEETGYIASKFAAMSARFLGRAASYLAAIPEDESIRRSVGAQAPLSQVSSQSPACQALTTLAEQLWSSLNHENSSQVQIKNHAATADTRG